MWRSRLSKAWDWVCSRRLVGEDEHHLFYAEFVEKGKPEKRYVEYKDNDITQASDRLPIEWWSWLHNRRDDAPSTAEIIASIRARERLASRVAVLEAEDERQRLRQMSGMTSDSNTEPNTLAPQITGTQDVINAAKAAGEELAARRRRKALERLQGAAVPPTAPADKRPPVLSDHDNDVSNTPSRERNTFPDPTVSNIVFVQSASVQEEITLMHCAPD